MVQNFIGGVNLIGPQRKARVSLWDRTDNVGAINGNLQNATIRFNGSVRSPRLRVMDTLLCDEERAGAPLVVNNTIRMPLAKRVILQKWSFSKPTNLTFELDRPYSIMLSTESKYYRFMRLGHAHADRFDELRCEDRREHFDDKRYNYKCNECDNILYYCKDTPVLSLLVVRSVCVQSTRFASRIVRSSAITSGLNSEEALKLLKSTRMLNRSRIVVKVDNT